MIVISRNTTLGFFAIHLVLASSCVGDQTHLVKTADSTRQSASENVEVDSAAKRSDSDLGSLAPIAAPTIPGPVDSSVCFEIPWWGQASYFTGSPDSVMHEFVHSSMKYGNTAASLSGCLGQPLKVVVDTYPDINSGAPTEVLRIWYEALQYRVLRELASGEEYLREVSAIEPTEGFAFNIDVGATWLSIVQRFGPPTTKERHRDGTLMAQYVVGEYSVVQFRVEGDTVRKISWQFVPD